MIRNRSKAHQLQLWPAMGMVLVTVILAMPAGFSQSKDGEKGSFPATVEQALLETTQTKALVQSMDYWVDNPGSKDAREACIAAAKLLSTQGDPSVDACYNAAKALESVGATDDAVAVLQHLIAVKADYCMKRYAVPVGIGARLWLARLMEEQGKDDDALKVVNEAAADMEKQPLGDGWRAFFSILRSELHQKKGNKSAADKELQDAVDKSEKSNVPGKVPSGEYFINYAKTRGKSTSTTTASPMSFMVMGMQMDLMGYNAAASHAVLGEKRVVLLEQLYEKVKKKSCFAFNRKVFAMVVSEYVPTSEVVAKDLAAIAKEDAYLAPVAEISRGMQAEQAGKAAEADAIFEGVKKNWKEYAPGVESMRSQMKMQQQMQQNKP